MIAKKKTVRHISKVDKEAAHSHKEIDLDKFPRDV
jgi:hypothetical protein